MNATETIAAALMSPVVLILTTFIAGMFMTFSYQQQKEINELRKKLGKED